MINSGHKTTTLIGSLNFHGLNASNVSKCFDTFEPFGPHKFELRSIFLQNNMRT
ncbi:hypothetical protein HYC85_016830 [Camellia sinensis]|uniref:Uncharacterized protein n=1 Tax=Camellia sinensis TaxID=4442 RepID=A0A7J7H0Q7_CAMSI|nr:hypothetical protein HYC85_016830 [Camellia sinensis]